jgi:hypothetical protein
LELLATIIVPTRHGGIYPVLGKLKQEDGELEASLSYRHSEYKASFT